MKLSKFFILMGLIVLLTACGPAGQGGNQNNNQSGTGNSASGSSPSGNVQLTATIPVSTKTIAPATPPTPTEFVNWLMGMEVKPLVAGLYPIQEGTGGLADCNITTTKYNIDIFVGADIYFPNGLPYDKAVPVGAYPVHFDEGKMIVDSHLPMTTRLLQAETSNPKFTHTMHFEVNLRMVSAYKDIDWVLWQVDQASDPGKPSLLLPNGQIDGVCNVLIDNGSGSGSGSGDANGDGIPDNNTNPTTPDDDTPPDITPNG